jgi:phenylalanyl-tRNA synthetase beta chain
MHVKPDTARIRPYVQAAVLRGVTFTPENYASFIDLQDKLHQNLARRRTLVSMGTHDLATIRAPFTYEALPPEQIKFVPLNRTQEVDGHGVMQLYETDPHMRGYLPIIRDSPVYPVIFDVDKVVCSLPPIINSNHSKITLDTKDVMIEITATDETRLEFAMNILVAMFSEYCAQPFT